MGSRLGTHPGLRSRLSRRVSLALVALVAGAFALVAGTALLGGIAPSPRTAAAVSPPPAAGAPESGAAASSHAPGAARSPAPSLQATARGIFAAGACGPPALGPGGPAIPVPGAALRGPGPSGSPIPSVATGGPSQRPGSSAPVGSAGAGTSGVPAIPETGPASVGQLLAGASPSPATILTWKDPALVAHVPILMYHRIIDPALAPTSAPNLVVPPAVFAAQMAALHAAGWHTVTLRTLSEILAAGSQPPPRTFVITFDDGHRDGFEYAAPILEHDGYVATYFVISGRVDHHDYLTSDQLCRLTLAGDEIANHTVRHLSLVGATPWDLAHEVDAAAAAIEGWTGVAPTSFAYPSGRWSPDVMNFIATRGYGMAVTTAGGVGETYANRLVLPRIRVVAATLPIGLVLALEPFA